MPDAYISEPELRLSFYKRLSATEDEAAIAELIAEIIDRYGPSPPQLQTLARAQGVRLAAQRIGATAVQRRSGRWRIKLDPAIAPPEKLGEVLTDWPDALLSPSGEITVPSGLLGSEIDQVLGLLNALGA